MSQNLVLAVIFLIVFLDDFYSQNKTIIRAFIHFYLTKPTYMQQL